MRVVHWQLIVKPFHDSYAVFDINACFCQIVSTQNDILLASLCLKYNCLLLIDISILVELR
jgi:hypothetical protein